MLIHIITEQKIHSKLNLYHFILQKVTVWCGFTASFTIEPDFFWCFRSCYCYHHWSVLWVSFAQSSHSSSSQRGCVDWIIFMQDSTLCTLQIQLSSYCSAISKMLELSAVILQQPGHPDHLILICVTSGCGAI